MGRKRYSARRFIQQTIHMALLLFILLPFQNCTNLFQTSLSSQGLVLSSKGNGETYEGKPDATFYRFIPNFNCNGTSTAAQVAELRDGQVKLFDNTGNQCSDHASVISPSDVNTSPFQKDFISIQDYLFKKYDQPVQGIPANLAEVLCRDDFINPQFEIVIHYDRERNSAQTRVYSKNKIVPDFVTSRILSSQDVRYVSDRLSFKVDFSKVVESNRRYAGTIENTALPEITKSNLTCVTGGSLDTSTWSFKNISERSVHHFQVLPSGNIEFNSIVAQGPIDPILHIFRVGPNLPETDLSKNLLSPIESVRLSNVLNNERYSLYNSYIAGNWYSLWYITDQQTQKVFQISNIGKDPVADRSTWESFVDPTTIFINEDLQVIFRVIHGYPSYLTTLRVFDLKTSLYDDAAKDNITLHRYLKATKQILYGVVNYSPKRNENRIYKLYDLRTKQTRILSIPTAVNCMIVGSSLKISADEKSFFDELLCDTSTGGIINKRVEVIIATGEMKTPTNYAAHFGSSDDDEWQLFGEPYKTPNLSDLYNRRTGEVFQIPIQSTQLAFLDDHTLFGFDTYFAPNVLYKTDLKTKKTVTVCDSAEGKKLNLLNFKNQKAFLLTYDENLKVYRFYHAKSATECLRINEFPSIYPFMAGLTVTKIGFSLNLANLYEYTFIREIVFIPIDGRPPMKLSKSTNLEWQIALAPAGDQIIILGPDDDGKRRLKAFSF